MKFIYNIIFCLLSIITVAQSNQLWKGYYSYQETTAVLNDNQYVFFATDNSIFSYNQYTNETEIYNTINGLKINGIKSLAYATDYKKLIVGSNNGKVAIVDLATDKIYHLNDIYSKTNIPDNQKQINRIVINGGYAYLATGFGITTVRLNDNHFGDTFYVGVDGEMKNISSIAIFNNHIYAAVSTEGLKKASLNTNLIDYNNWQVINFDNWLDLAFFADKLVGVKEDLSLNTISTTNTIEKVDDVWGGFLKLNVSKEALIEVTHEAARLRANDLSAYDAFVYSQNEFGGISDATYIGGYFYAASRNNGALKVQINQKDVIENLSPIGPLSNNISSAVIHDNSLWLTFGGYGVSMNPYVPNGLTKYGISTYKYMQSWKHTSFNELNQFKSIVNISFNPQKPNIAYLSSFHDGLALWDITTNEVSVFNQDNTGVLQEIIEDDIRVYGVSFDRNGTGWLTNTITNPFLVSIDKNNQFAAHPSNIIISQQPGSDAFMKPIIDKNNTKWFASRLSGVFAFNETRNNKAMQIDTNHNLPSSVVKCLAIDYNNTLWIGTFKGIRVIRNVDQFLTSSQLTTNNIVIEDLGLGQELFFEQDVWNITVDGSNNKWVSIANAGVFLISDKYETIYNFTTDNSPLPSNDVENITIDGATGEVFFVTRKGMVSFKNYATTPLEDLNDIKVYPNPVRPEYSGDVKISGLVADATVKITDIAGNLVHETKSLGGTVTWNTLNFSGNKVPSGVYMIFITSKEGEMDAVKKVMIVR